MNKSMRKLGLLPALLCVAAGVQSVHAADAPGTAVAGSPVPARWVTRKFSLTFMGFTAHYSCDGLRDNVRDILLQLGARKEDLKLREIGCVRLEGPSPMPGVDGTFSVLVPVDQIKPTDVLAAALPKTTGTAGAEPLPAQWRSVDLIRALRYGSDLTGNCELLEQVKQDILPLMSGRNLEYRALCVPYTATVGGVTFKLDVLKPPAPAQVAQAQ